MGSGFSEIVYKDALEHEFKICKIPFNREVEFRVNYKDIILSHYFVADFVIYNSIILEAKSVKELTNEHFAQTINYLAVSGLNLGLLINFRSNKLQYKRVILNK